MTSFVPEGASLPSSGGFSPISDGGPLFSLPWGGRKFCFILPKDFFLCSDIIVMEASKTMANLEAPQEPNPVQDRRRQPRTVFTYPVESKLFLKTPLSLKGYLKDISLGGSCLEFDDPFRRILPEEVLHATIKITIEVPGIDKMAVLGKVRWIKPVEGSTTVRMGVELKEVSMYQIELISKLMGLRNRDHSMLWNLWETFQNRPEF